MIEKTDKFDQKVSQKYIKELLSKKIASGSTYQKGSLDEILIHKFLEKQKMKEKDLQQEDNNSKLKEKEDEIENNE